MLRFLLVPICFLSALRAFQLDHCDAFPKSHSNLSHSAVIVVGFREKTRIDVDDEKFFESSAILKTFYECYGATAGLEVHSVTFERKKNTSGGEKLCEMVPGILLRYDMLLKKKVRLAITEGTGTNCDWKNIVSIMFPFISRNEILNNFHCSDHVCRIQMGKRTLLELQGTLPDTPLYEMLEMQVDSLTRKENQSIPSNTHYEYFMTFSPKKNKTKQYDSASFFLIFDVVVGTILLIVIIWRSFQWIEDLLMEDFWFRNEEQEWLEMQRDLPSTEESLDSGFSSLCSTQSVSLSSSSVNLQDTQSSGTSE